MKIADFPHSRSNRDPLDMHFNQTRRETSVTGRLAAAIVLGLVLLLLSAIINIAKGATAAGLSPIWISWAVTVVIVVARRRRRLDLPRRVGRAVFRLLSWRNHVVGVVAVVFARRRGDSAIDSGLGAVDRPLAAGGRGRGRRHLSGAMGIAAVILTIVFLTASYFLLYRHHDRHAR